jgi:hypothetical protein
MVQCYAADKRWERFYAVEKRDRLPENRREIVLCTSLMENWARDIEPILFDYLEIYENLHGKFCYECKNRLELVFQEKENGVRNFKVVGDIRFHIDEDNHIVTDYAFRKFKFSGDVLFRKIKTYEITAVNNQPTQKYLGRLNRLSLNDVMRELEHLTLTFEPCRPQESTITLNCDFSAY